MGSECMGGGEQGGMAVGRSVRVWSLLDELTVGLGALELGFCVVLRWGKWEAVVKACTLRVLWAEEFWAGRLFSEICLVEELSI